MLVMASSAERFHWWCLAGRVGKSYKVPKANGKGVRAWKGNEFDLPS